VIYGKIMMNNLVSQAGDRFPGHLGMPVPDFIGDCSCSFADLLYVAFNGIDRLLAKNEFI